MALKKSESSHPQTFGFFAKAIGQKTMPKLLFMDTLKTLAAQLVL
jgi:hypothetical protein